MFNTDEAQDWAADDIARNGPFPPIEDAIAGAVTRLQREREAEAWAEVRAFRSRREAQCRLIRASIALAAFLFVALVVLGAFAARAQEAARPAASTQCPPAARSCKVLVLTPEEEQALMQPRGVLDTAREARPLDLGQIVPYFREKISQAPAGTVPAPPAPPAGPGSTLPPKEEQKP